MLSLVRRSLFNRCTKLCKSATYSSFTIIEKPLITVTGFDGFLGPYTALEFLKDGKYHVRATVRKNPDESKMAAIKQAYGKLFDKIDIVEAELLEEGSMSAALEGSTYVAHLASPYYLDNKTREELVRPAVQGTMEVLKACTEHSVKKCVVTSSFACIRWTAREDLPPDGIFTEDYWSNPERPEGMGDYAVSKTLAEREAWDYLATLKDPFDLVAICPVLLLGPGIGGANVVSEGFITSLLTDQEPEIKCASNGYVDVRDVARAHFLAIDNPEAKNRRYILSGEEMTKHQIVEVLTQSFGGYGFQPGCEKLDDSAVGQISVDNSASREHLGVQYRPLKQTIIEMIDSLLASGRIRKPSN